MFSVRAIIRSACARFCPPAALLTTAGIVPLILVKTPGLDPYAPAVLAMDIVSATIGYAGTLLLMRRRLRDDAPILARPAIVAGVLSPVVIMLALIVGPHPGIRGVDALLSLAAGALLSAAMFSPWLTRERSAQAESAAGSFNGTQQNLND